MPKVRLPRQWKFGSVPEEVLNSGVSIYSKMVIAAITYHAFDDGPAWPGTERLSRLCSCSKRAVLRAIPELEKYGFLRVERTKGKVNEYQFLSKTSDPQSPVSKGVVPTSHQTCAPQSPPPVTDSHPNETKSTRPLNETKNATTPQGAFVDWFKVEYLNRFGKPYVDSGGDYSTIQKVLKDFKGDVGRVQKLVLAGWEIPDERNGYSVAKICMTVRGFCSKVNQINLVEPKKAESKYKSEVFNNG